MVTNKVPRNFQSVGPAPNYVFNGINSVEQTGVLNIYGASTDDGDGTISYVATPDRIFSDTVSSSGSTIVGPSTNDSFDINFEDRKSTRLNSSHH